VNERRPRLLLHLGQHKTGSKALQAYLAHNRQVLRELGILYPVEDSPAHTIPAYSHSQFRLFALLRRDALAITSVEAAARVFWEPLAGYCQPFTTTRDLFESWEAERLRLGSESLLVSAEDLFDMHTAHELGFSLAVVQVGARLLAELAAAFAYDVRLVVYLRRQDHLLGTHYGQLIKGSSAQDLDMAAFATAFGPRLDSRRLLSCWEAAFGREAIQVRPYEPELLPAGIVGDFFPNVLGLPVPARCREPEADVESVNRSLGRDFIEYLRLLNRRQANGQEVCSRDAVLRTALRHQAALGGPRGIAAWLSPRQRRQLLDRHGSGNAHIARAFLGREDGRLFAEPLPTDTGWRPYSGLTAETARALTRAIQETLAAQG
jgi:hypothetical protein